jgi:glutamate racemase
MKIGVFDSGFGGLTVMRALLKQLPGADYIYLGDTARLPYGAKSKKTVERYAVSSARFLVEEGSEYLVIACNTASALALDAIRDAVRVPVLGVIETGANAALAATQTKDILVMATAATVESHAYSDACQQRGLNAFEMACPLLVPLVEEGWIDHPVTEEVLSIYVAAMESDAAAGGLNPDTLVLGCTHYPLLRASIERLVPEGVRVIDSADVTAEQVAAAVRKLRGDSTSVSPDRHPDFAGSRLFYATDSVEKFRWLGATFLGQPIGRVELIDLGG